MGSNQSARRKSVSHCTPVGTGVVPCYDYSRTTSNPITSTSKRFGRRAKVRRSISDKFVILTNSSHARNEWELAASKRAVSTASDVGHESMINKDEISDSQKQTTDEKATNCPYQPFSLHNWKMIDEEGNDNSLEKLLELNAVIDKGTAEIMGASKRPISNIKIAPLDARYSGPGTAIQGELAISSHNVKHSIGKTLLANANVSESAQHRDESNSRFTLKDASVISLEPVLCAVQTKSLKLPDVDGPASTDEVCSCKLRYRPLLKCDYKLASESGMFATNKESSINSAASRDSGRASSDEASGTNRTPPDKDRCENLCLSLCSLASDDLMLETEDENFTGASFEGNRSHHIEHSYPSVEHTTDFAQRRRTLSLNDSIDFMKLQSVRDVEMMKKQGITQTELHRFTNVAIDDQANKSKQIATSQCSSNSRGVAVQDVQHDSDLVAEYKSSISTLHFLEPNGKTLFEMDTTTYQGIAEDVTEFRNELLKLQRLLQENGFRHDSSIPDSSASNLSSPLLVESNTSKLLKENAELKTQVEHLQQIAEQQKATILLLQQHMIKCESGTRTPIADSLINE